jgi:hypothetical protein
MIQALKQPVTFDEFLGQAKLPYVIPKECIVRSEDGESGYELTLTTAQVFAAQYSE